MELWKSSPFLYHQLIYVTIWHIIWKYWPIYLSAFVQCHLVRLIKTKIWKHYGVAVNSTSSPMNTLLYLQAINDWGKGQILVKASMTVKGMEVASKKSDMARLKMKTFLAVLISFLRRTVDITVRLPRTKINIFLF